MLLLSVIICVIMVFIFLAIPKKKKASKRVEVFLKWDCSCILFSLFFTIKGHIWVVGDSRWVELTYNLCYVEFLFAIKKNTCFYLCGKKRKINCKWCYQDLCLMMSWWNSKPNGAKKDLNLCGNFEVR